jgi:type II secretory pathway component PulF
MMTNNLATMIEPVMLIIMGVVVGFIAVAVYMPLFSLAEVIG